MAAPKGNSFWRMRSSHGRKPIFADSDQLWDACLQYFQWVEDNPLEEAKLVSYQGVSSIEAVPKKRLMTINALCLFLDITLETWSQYRRKEEFTEVCTRAEEFIKQDKMEGAAAEFFSAAIIARDLGLTDKTKTTVEMSAEVMLAEAGKRVAEKKAKDGGE